MSVGPERDATAPRRLLVALLNLAYFGVEFAVATAIGSVSLFADSVDFLEDASINLLILVGLGWSAARRALLGMVLAGILLVPGFATLWTAWDKFLLPLPPAPVPLTLAGAGALAVNLDLRAHPGALSRPRRQPHPRGFSIGPQRYVRQCRDHRGRLRHRGDAFGLARSPRRACALRRSMPAPRMKSTRPRGGATRRRKRAVDCRLPLCGEASSRRPRPAAAPRSGPSDRPRY